MSHTKPVVKFYTDTGITTYRPLSARIPAFLAQYGPEKGYAMTTEIRDSLSLKPGLLRLYEIAIQAGRKPEELGLPPFALVGQTQICRATLMNESGRIVACATAAKHIQAYKDLEVLETAARQRLLAALGFGGEVFDDDENQDQDDQGLSGVSTSCSTSDQTTSPPAPSLPAAALQTDDTLLVTSEPDEDTALAMLRRQIEHLGKIKGVDVYPVTNKAEAQAALKRLMQTPTP